jgi:K+-transporting ATPase ATPase C chain
MKTEIIRGLKLTLVCIIFFSGIYTLFILAVAQLAPNHGEGEIISDGGKIYYSNVGQSFTNDRYFNSRPSAVDYNAAASGGSNKGPSNPDYLASVGARIDTFLVHNPGIERASVPSELVTASGSGLDPHISVQAARIQVKRIAQTRNIPESELNKLIDNCTEEPLLGLFGTEKINLLKLNISLNQFSKR